MQRDFGMSAQTVWDTPEWVLDVLIGEWNREQGE